MSGFQGWGRYCCHLRWQEDRKRGSAGLCRRSSCLQCIYFFLLSALLHRAGHHCMGLCHTQGIDSALTIKSMCIERCPYTAGFSSQALPSASLPQLLAIVANPKTRKFTRMIPIFLCMYSYKEAEYCKTCSDTNRTWTYWLINLFLVTSMGL